MDAGKIKKNKEKKGKDYFFLLTSRYPNAGLIIATAIARPATSGAVV
jgi:hypothetical protein